MKAQGFSTRGFPCRARVGRIPRRLKKRFKVAVTQGFGLHVKALRIRRDASLERAMRGWHALVVSWHRDIVREEGR